MRVPGHDNRLEAVDPTRTVGLQTNVCLVLKIAVDSQGALRSG